MKIKSFIIYFTLFTALPSMVSKSASAQEESISHILNNDQTGASRNYVGRDFVSLKPGFYYKASQSTNFDAKTDPLLVFPPTGNTYADANGNIVDHPLEGAVVGNLSGSFDVSPTGAATYTVPIEVLPGVQKMQPNISLVYNSQSGNGIAGMCWSLSGLSAISRVTKDYFFNDERSGVVWDSLSPLSIDGQRLIEVRKWGNDSIEYCSESTTDTIRGYNIMSFGPSYFKVYTKEGRILTYGRENNLDYLSLIRMSWDPSAIASSIEIYNLGWLLYEVRDNNNNYIRYTYANTKWDTKCTLTRCGNYHGDNRVSKIEYGTENTKVASVHFQYKNKTHSHIQYIDSIATKNELILNKIEIKGLNDELHETYQLNYETHEQNDFLTQIERSNSSGEFIHPLKFEWYPMNYKYEYSDQISFTGAPQFSSISKDTEAFSAYSYGDIDGDGLIDILVRTSLVRDESPKHYWMVYRNLGDDIYKYEYGEEWDKGNENTFLFLDKDNDGKDELYVGRVKPTPSDTAAYHFYLNCYKYAADTDNKMSFQRYPSDDEGIGTTKDIYENRASLYILPGDYAGKGSTQFIGFYGQNTPKFFFGFTLDPKVFPFSGGEKKRVFLTDINGNGKTEIAFIDKGTTTFYEYQQSSKEFERILVSDLFYFTDHIQVGDFNGDGHTDLLVKKDESLGKRTIYISTGQGFIEKDMDSEISYTVSPGHMKVVDINKDGKSDIFVVTPNFRPTGGAESCKLEILISNGDSFTSRILNDDFPFIISGPFVISGKVLSGHSLDLLTYKEYKTGSPQVVSLSPDIWYNKIKNITDAFGKQLTISYKDYKNPSIAFPTFSNLEELKNSIVNTVAPQLEVVDKITAPNINQSYAYSDFKIDQLSRGHLGFSVMKTTDNIRSIVTEVENKLNKSYSILYPYKNTVKVRGTLVKESTQIYRLLAYSGKRYFLRQDSLISKDALKGTTVKTSYSDYDIHRNPCTVKTDYGNGFTTTETMAYVKKGSLFLNKLSLRQITQKATGQPDVMRTEYFFYDNKGNITYHVKDSADANKVQIFYTNYDQYGNPGKITTTANNISRSKSMTYCSYGRFLKTETDLRFNETTTYNYDESKGLLTSQTDRTGTTSFQYDGFGRLKSTIYPDNVKKAISLQWAGTLSGKPSNALYYSYTETSGQAPVWVWYDNQGREIRQDTYVLNQQKVHTDTEYDEQGRVLRVSKPYTGSAPGMWADSCAYDQFGRISSRVTPLGTISYAYDKLTTTVTTPTDKKKTTVNAAGWVVEEETNGKKVNFTHYASGLIKTATPQNGQAVSMEYDLQGNRTKLTDPDAGVITSEYDGWGQLTKEQQAVHNASDVITVSYQYHPSGLLQYKLCNGEKTDYGYDGLHRLNRISIAGKHAQGIVYDRYDRIIQNNDTIEASKVFVSKTEYNSSGNIYKETYPSGYSITNLYDANGYLTRITDKEGRSVWEAVEANAEGMLTKTKRGGRETGYTYNPKGQLERIYASGIIDEQYAYYADGNLEKRTDGLHTQYEWFAYDNYNRLANYNVYRNSVPVKESFTDYEPKMGNLMTKSDLGAHTLYYGENAGPHALTSISGVPPAIAATNLDITYTDFRKVAALSEGNKRYSLAYGVDELRSKSVYSENGVAKLARYYLGNYEEEIDSTGNIRKIHYIGADDGLAAVYIQNRGCDSMLYVYSDRLGSLVALTNEKHSVVERYAFDPWGQRCNPSDWSQTDTRTAWVINRGFTGHEHLDAFDVIDMNGRVYDPLTAQFFSPDPYIQAPGNWLNYNRYSYCLNNPVMNTDPNGEFFLSTILGPLGVAIDAACWGAVIGGAGYTASIAFSNGGFKNWDWKQFGKAAGFGALSGVATAGIGNAIGPVGSHGFWGEAGRAAIHGFSNGMISQVSGGDFLQGFASGGLSSIAGSSFMMYGGSFAASEAGTYAFSGLAGGVGAELSGGNFWEGAAIGVMNAGLNHLQQGVNKLIYEETFRRIGYVPLDEKVGYQMAAYKMRLRVFQNKNKLILEADAFNTLVDGDVIAGAEASLMVNNKEIISKALSLQGKHFSPKNGFKPLGSTSFTMPTGNVSVHFQGGWTVYMNGGASVPIYHPFTPVPININKTIKIK